MRSGSGQSVKLSDLRERLATLVAEGYRALVFTQFTDAVLVHGNCGCVSGLSAAPYTGEMDLAQRDAVTSAFKEDASHSVLVLSVRRRRSGTQPPGRIVRVPFRSLVESIG